MQNYGSVVLNCVNKSTGGTKMWWKSSWQHKTNTWCLGHTLLYTWEEKHLYSRLRLDSWLLRGFSRHSRPILSPPQSLHPLTGERQCWWYSCICQEGWPLSAATKRNRKPKWYPGSLAHGPLSSCWCLWFRQFCLERDSIQWPKHERLSVPQF